MKFSFKTSLILLLLMTGCAINQQWIKANQEERKAIFEDGLNSELLQSITTSLKKAKIVEVKEIDQETKEYIIHSDYFDECLISFTVKNDGDVLMAWEYVSDPNECLKDVYLYGA